MSHLHPSTHVYESFVIGTTGYTEWQAFCLVFWIEPPAPSPESECRSAPLCVQEGNTRIRGRGWGDSIRPKGQTLWRWGFFYREPSAAGGYYWLPALLGWNLANAGNTKTVENNRNWAMLLLHDVYFIRSKDPQIHNNHGCKTTINWFRRTCKESKTTLYYWLYTMFIMQFTDLLIVHSFFSFYLSFLCFEACLFQWLWKPAK